MRNLETALTAIGATFEDVVRRTIYTTQPSEFETITAAIEKVQGSSDHPAQTIAGVSGLALPGLMIEIEATVSLP
jgi:enamine deaminase RidA (YjgF/YER057c/UK114 family)